MNTLTFTEIEFTSESIQEAKKEGYTHLLSVNGCNGHVLYALHRNNWNESANAIAKEEGFEAHDHSSDSFMGCNIDESKWMLGE